METKGWQEFYHILVGKLLTDTKGNILTKLQAGGFFGKYIKENYLAKGLYTHFMVFWELALLEKKELKEKTKLLLQLFNLDIEVDYDNRPQLWRKGQQLIAAAPDDTSKNSACSYYDAIFEKMYAYIINGKQDVDRGTLIESMNALVASGNGVQLMNLSGVLSCVYPSHFISLIGDEIKKQLKVKTNKTWDNARTAEEYLELCEQESENLAQAVAYYNINLNKREQEEFSDWLVSENNPNKKKGTGAGYKQYSQSVNRCINKLLECSAISKDEVKLNDAEWLNQIAERIQNDQSLKDINDAEHGQLRCALKALSKYREWQNSIKGSASTGGEDQAERKHPLNQILYGPPGTGKTYNTVIYAVAICENKNINEVEIEKYDDVFKTYKGYKANGLIEFITFHQSYGYEEFIQGIKPSVNDKEQVFYKIEDGIFKAFCDKAKNNPNQNYVFIIDEINRGNVSKIFGELITLIEESKRISENNPDQGMKVKLPYNSEEFGVPENVYLLGTMNTADRSLVQLDAALRRRFRFIEMMPKYNVLSDDADGINVQELLKAINKQIREKIDREHQIGHSYFIDVTTEAQLKETFENEIIPLLQEYFYENYESIKEILGGQDFTDEEEKIDLSSFDFKKIYEKTND